MSTQKAELDKQSLALAELINTTIVEYGQALQAAGRVPMLNAVAMALVSNSGSIIASVKDRHARIELQRIMENGLSVAIAAHDHQTINVEMMVVEGGH